MDDAGRVSLAKSASTPADPSIGVMDGLALLAAELGTDLAGLLADTGLIVHGTTVATNALLERKGAKVGMLTTAGHRDVIEMREGLKDDRYNLRMAPPVPLVPRARRLDVTERMRFDGTRGDAALEDLRGGGDPPARRRGRRRGRGLLPALLSRSAPRAGDPEAARAPAARRLRVALFRRARRRSRSTSASAPPW